MCKVNNRDIRTMLVSAGLNKNGNENPNFPYLNIARLRGSTYLW